MARAIVINPPQARRRRDATNKCECGECGNQRFGRDAIFTVTELDIRRIEVVAGIHTRAVLILLISRSPP